MWIRGWLENMNDFAQANAWATALTGQPETAVFNWRFIHDKDKATAAIKRRGTLAQMWAEACNWNAAGYGIFATVNEMDGTGYSEQGQPLQGESGDKLTNVRMIRAHVVDLDNLSAMQNLQRAAQHNPAPQFAVQTSPGKAHVYWVSHYPANLETYRTLQRKLRQFFDGDKAVIDATRVLRVPGFLHQKGAPHLVTCYSLPGYGYTTSADMLAISLAHVNAVDDYAGRHKLGEPELAAPGPEWLWYALDSMPVDGMSHPDFISFTAAWKQAGWNVADHDEMRTRWLAWCDRFGTESKGVDYNLKHWNSIEDTEIGWKSLLFRNPNLNAQFMFRGAEYSPPAVAVQTAPAAPLAQPGPSPIPTQDTGEELGGLLLAEDCAEYFKGCTFVTQFGEILDPKGQMLGPGQFNGKYGGPRFVINHTGAPSDEPWKAATRSIFWRIPTVDYLRFLPHEPTGEIIKDELGRTGVNTYRPAIIRTLAGDPAPFFHHLSLMFPVESDRKILLDFIAHNAQYPGHKIPWAPLLQSTEGAGKGIFKSLFRHIVGSAYFHSPNAQELVESGSKFNAWMRGKLFILVDEIKTDERRDMIETLKPMISETEIEIQAKGHDQRKEDNYSNWAFFSNYKDAVPINQNSRRFAIFYSSIQSKADLKDRDMNDHYFDWLHNWFNQRDGAAILAHYFKNEYQIERGSIPMVAPATSSYAEAIRQGRTANERIILDAIDAGLSGFKAGWISTGAAMKQIRTHGGRIGSMSGVERIIEGLGFHMIGRAPNAFFQESQDGVPVLFHLDKTARLEDYAPQQSYGAF